MKLDVDYSPEPAVSERDHGHGRDQQQLRDPGRDRDVRRSGHRREFDARQPHRSLSDRVEGVVRDVGTFRAVALADVVNRQFDGHPFAARQGIAQAEQQGWIVRQHAQGAEGETLHGDRGDAGRRGTGGGAVGQRRPGGPAGSQRGGQDGGRGGTRSRCIAPRVRRRRGSRRRAGALPGSGSMPNSRGRWPHGRSVRGRRRAGRAAEAARRRAAAELHLPVEHGTVLFPDAQIEYVTATGLAGRCNVEVASEHYGGGAHPREGGGRVPAVRRRRPGCHGGAAGARDRWYRWRAQAWPPRRDSRVRGLRAVRPWRVAVGLTMTGGALAVWALWLELAYVRPYWQVLLADYGWYHRGPRQPGARDARGRCLRRGPVDVVGCGGPQGGCSRAGDSPGDGAGSGAGGGAGA